MLMDMQMLHIPENYNRANLTEDLHNFKHHIKEAKNSVYKTLTDAKMQTKNAVNASLKSVKDNSDLMQHKISNYIKMNPLKTIGVSILFGVLSSKFLRF